MKTGKKLDYNQLVQALLASLRHKNQHLASIVDVLLNYEDFHTTQDSMLLRNIYEADQKNRLFQDPDGIRLVSAIQLQTAMRLRRWIDQY